MNWHNILIRPEDLWEELMRRKLISGGGAVYEATSTTGVFYTDMTAPLKKLLVSLEPIQSGSGTPSPDNVRPISGHTECEVEVCGKNLHKPYSYSGTAGNVTLTYADDGSVTLNGSANGTAGTPGVAVAIQNGYSYTLPAGTYTISVSGDTTNVNFRVYATATNQIIANNGTPTFTLSEATSVLLRCGVVNGKTYNNQKVYMQLEQGSSATAYEPYNGHTYTTDLGRTVYGGTLDVVSGVLTVDRVTMTFDGTQTVGRTNWQPQTNSVGWLYAVETTPNIKRSGLIETNLSNLISDRLETVVYGGNSGVYGADKPCISIVGGNSWGIAMRMTDTSLTTSTAINAWLEDNPVQVAYKLAEPQTYQLTPQQIRTLKGNNTVTAEGADVIEVVYLTHLVD